MSFDTPYYSTLYEISFVMSLLSIQCIYHNYEMCLLKLLCASPNGTKIKGPGFDWRLKLRRWGGCEWATPLLLGAAGWSEKGSGLSTETTAQRGPYAVTWLIPNPNITSLDNNYWSLDGIQQRWTIKYCTLLLPICCVCSAAQNCGIEWEGVSASTETTTQSWPSAVTLLTPNPNITAVDNTYWRMDGI